MLPCLTAVCLLILSGASADRSFSIDYDHNCFLKDGKPFQYISGSLHYSRIPPEYWQDRIDKLKAAGLNAVEFYVPWNWHAPTMDGPYDWAEWSNLTHYLDMINRADLVAIVRIGPYICGEWENGGFPWWLLKIPGIEFRTWNDQYIKQVERWYAELLPKMLKPMLYENGGPIVLVQIENEYGSRSMCSQPYLKYLRDTAHKYLGEKVQLITVDGDAKSYLKCGTVSGVYATVDFGTTDAKGVAKAFEAQRAYSPKGPLVNTEFYLGWLDLWGEPWATVETGTIISTLREMYQVHNASVNLYMIHGGTNFGFWNGAHGGVYKHGGQYVPVVTSYDYDAPISEAGDPTSKFMQLRAAIAEMTGRQPLPVPAKTTKVSYGTVHLQRLGPVTAFLPHLAPKPTNAPYPLTFEQLNAPYGFVMYETKLGDIKASSLNITGVGDRAYVLVNDDMVAIVNRTNGSSIAVDANTAIRRISILVENQGRSNDGSLDPKGLLRNITITVPSKQPQILTNWTMSPLDLTLMFPPVIQQDPPSPPAVQRGSSTNAAIQPRTRNRSRYQTNRSHQDRPATFKAYDQSEYVPSIFYGTFGAATIADTYFDPTGWRKGQLYINGFNLGRYWPALGPQVTLFIPKYVLRSVNTVVLLELEGAGLCTDDRNCSISFTTTPYLNKTVPRSVTAPMELVVENENEQ